MQWKPHYIFLLNTFLILTIYSQCQLPDFSKSPGMDKGDSVQITSLIRTGVKIKRSRVVCWFPRDSMPLQQMNEIADSINSGVEAAEKMIAAPQDWQAHPYNQPYVFYFRKDTIISHASLAGFVSISFWRIKEGKAPWLHEAVHEILYAKKDKWFSKEITDSFYNKNAPKWLFEGLADYLSQEVSHIRKLTFYDVFSGTTNPNTDSLFIKDMKSTTGQYILAFIGAKGVMPELYSVNRRFFAPAFYHGSCSFVKFIAEHYGLALLLKANSAFTREQETIEHATGRSLPDLKHEWLKKINLIN